MKLEALWRLKHLRLGFRHDVDHGSDRDVVKKNRQIGEAFKALINEVIPRDESEWRTAQVKLYQELIDMLEQIWYGDGDY
jgi:hypothetical protein